MPPSVAKRVVDHRPVASSSKRRFLQRGRTQALFGRRRNGECMRISRVATRWKGTSKLVRDWWSSAASNATRQSRERLPDVSLPPIVLGAFWPIEKRVDVHREGVRPARGIGALVISEKLVTACWGDFQDVEHASLDQLEAPA